LAALVVEFRQSEAAAGRMRAEVARLQTEVLNGQRKLVEHNASALAAQGQAAAEQNKAAASQAQAAEAQQLAATAQRAAALVQTEAAQAQADAAVAQSDAAVHATRALAGGHAPSEALSEGELDIAKGQVALLRNIEETLQEQLAAMRQQARSMGWVAFSSLLAALISVAIATVVVYVATSNSLTEGASQVAESLGEAIASAQAEGGGSAAADQGAADRAEIRQQLDERGGELAVLEETLSLVGARLAAANQGEETDAMELTAPDLGDRSELSWKRPPLKQWLTKARPLSEGNSSLRRNTIKGTLDSPWRDGASLYIDVFTEHWWPAGGPIEVGRKGAWSGELTVDSKNLPSRLRLSLHEGKKVRVREYTFAE
jgi:hypothetical protein